MGKPTMRLNPKVESTRNRTLLEKALPILVTYAFLLPKAPRKGRGRPAFDYRSILVLSIIRIMLKKTYADYDTFLRTDWRLKEMLNLKNLPCKSTLNNYDIRYFTMHLLVSLNHKLLKDWLKKPTDFLLDASGIRINGRSVWYSIRTKRQIRKKECDKVHIAVTDCYLLIANFRITSRKRNDSPFLRSLLKAFNDIGLVIADKGYSSKTNALFVIKKGGAFFSPFKSNHTPKGFNGWAWLSQMWKAFEVASRSIYNKRNRVEAVFSALKRRYGDHLGGTKWFTRRREMALRFIAYNLRVIVAIQISREKEVPFWVRA